MPDRRGFLLSALACAGVPGKAQSRPRLAFAPSVENGVTFRRAYSASPGAGILPLVTGIFPHAYGASEPERLTRFFEVTGSIDDSTIVIAAGRSGEDWSEAGVHIPLAIRVPGKLEGNVFSDVLISTIDVLPTIMSLAGIPIPENVHGRPVTLTAPPASVYAEGALGQPSEWRMIVRGFDKMVTTKSLQPTHLFNLGDDPTELQDLALEPGHRLKVDELKALMLDWKKRSGDGLDRSGLKRRTR